MAEFTLYSNQKINWNAHGVERMLQNISNLLNTFMYEVAYDRVMGRDPSNVDKPFDKVLPAIIAETYEVIEEYEPRVSVKDVKVEQQIGGEIIIEVVVDIGD